MFYSWLNKHILFPLFDLLSGHTITKQYKQYMRNQWRSREQIEKTQFNNTKKLLMHAYRNVPYYTKLFKKHRIDPRRIKTRKDLLKIPILTKEDINKNRKPLISKTAKIKSLSISQSGGSTGEPITFYLDKHALDAHKAINMRFYSMMDLRIGDRAARIWGQPRVISAAKTLKGRIHERLNNRIFMDGFDLSEKTMRKYVKRILKFKPKLIMGYVLCIDLLAQYIEKHKIKGIQPNAVFTTTSVLYPDIRSRIERVLGCKVFNEYGSCEVGAVAHECKEHKEMHMDTEICLIEFINNGKPAKPNEDAELIVTTLCNYSMPLIRYKIGDIGSFSNRKCNCGRGLPMLESITGRTFGVFTALDNSKVHGYYFTNRVFMKMPNVKQFQMIQKTKKDYLIKIVKNPGFNDDDTAFIEKMLRDRLGKGINIKYQYLKKIDPESSGKYLYTKSYLKEGY